MVFLTPPKALVIVKCVSPKKYENGGEMVKNVMVLCFRREFDCTVKSKLVEMGFKILSFGQNLEKRDVLESIEKYKVACGIVVVYGRKKSDNRQEAEEMKKVCDDDNVEFIKI